MERTCNCGGELAHMTDCLLPCREEGNTLDVEVWQCKTCSRLSFFSAAPQRTAADWEKDLADCSADDLTLLAFTADTPQEREAAENVLWEKFHELASY